MHPAAGFVPALVLMFPLSILQASVGILGSVMKWELCLLLSEMRADQLESVTTDKLETYLALKRMRDFNDCSLCDQDKSPFTDF